MLTAQLHGAIANDEMLSRVIEGTISMLSPEMIICFGKRTKSFDAWSCFLNQDESNVYRAYDLLVVLSNNSQRREQDVVASIENYNGKGFEVTALVHRLSAVEDALRDGGSFFRRAIRGGIVLYNARTNQQKFVADDIAEENWRRPNTARALQWQKRNSLARKFWSAASYFAGGGSHDLAVFMLHQSIEQTAIGLIRAHLDYKPSSHNLRRLLRMIETFAPFSARAFLGHTEEHDAIFDVLARAYSDVRYNDGFVVSEEAVRALLDRVGRLHRFSENLMKELLGEQELTSAVTPCLN